MPVSSRPANPGAQGSGATEHYGSHGRGHKRPRSQLSNGSQNSRSHIASPPGGSGGASRPGSWPPQCLGAGGGPGAGPTISIPDTRYSFSSSRPPTRYNQVVCSTHFLSSQRRISLRLWPYFKLKANVIDNVNGMLRSWSLSTNMYTCTCRYK